MTPSRRISTEENTAKSSFLLSLILSRESDESRNDILVTKSKDINVISQATTVLFRHVPETGENKELDGEGKFTSTRPGASELEPLFSRHREIQMLLISPTNPMKINDALLTYL